MNTVAVEKINLHKMLDQIPEDRMKAVKRYLDDLVEKTPPSPSRASLAGIWRGTEFEKLDDGNLEQDLQALREEMSAGILSKEL